MNSPFGCGPRMHQRTHRRTTPIWRVDAKSKRQPGKRCQPVETLGPMLSATIDSSRGVGRTIIQHAPSTDVFRTRRLSRLSWIARRWGEEPCLGISIGESMFLVTFKQTYFKNRDRTILDIRSREPFKTGPNVKMVPLLYMQAPKGADEDTCAGHDVFSGRE